MITRMEKRKKIVYEVIDVQEGIPFFTSDVNAKNDKHAAISALGHPCIVREARV